VGYIRALHRAGGREAVLLPLEIDAGEAAAILERFDGLLLVGGGDVDPGRYGEDPHPEVYGVNVEHDAFEIALARAAGRLGLPTLAICRGIQVLNVALGGTLEQHLDGDAHGDPRAHQPSVHPVEVDPDSRVAEAMGGLRADVPSHHHQAVALLGDGLRATGRAPDGVVEAVELDDAWVVGVQWHPEHAAESDRRHQGLFDAMVAAARKASRPGAG
jgi:putative glutamine amidotransferase